MSSCTSARWASCYAGSASPAYRSAPSTPRASPRRKRRSKKFADLVHQALPERAAGKPVEIWFADEARVGQQGTLTRIWARRGSRPRAPRDRRYSWAYLFGAVCPERAVGAALVLPLANTEAMNLHLAEIGRHVRPGAHAVLVLDGAGWHGAKDLRWPGTSAPLPLPASSPELNPQERVREFLRQHHQALRRFLDHGALLDACQDAWRRFIGQPGRVRSLCSYPWATTVP